MEKFLKKIQNKPEHVRWRILYVTLTVCMMLVIIVWIGAVREKMISDQTNTVEEKISTSPFKVLKNGIFIFYQDFLDGVDKVKTNIGGG